MTLTRSVSAINWPTPSQTTGERTMPLRVFVHEPLTYLRPATASEAARHRHGEVVKVGRTYLRFLNDEPREDTAPWEFAGLGLFPEDVELVGLVDGLDDELRVRAERLARKHWKKRIHPYQFVPDP